MLEKLHLRPDESTANTNPKNSKEIVITWGECTMGHKKSV